MKKVLVVFAGLTVATSIAACGGQTKTVVQTVTAAAATTPTTTAAAATTTTTSAPTGPPDCNAAGINDVRLKQGTCVDKGSTLTIVNKASILHLKTLDATLNGVTSQDSLSDGSGGGSATANGKFEILTVTLKNRLDSPQQWQNGQGGLEVATGPNSGSSYSEDFNAENGPDQNSCMWKAGGASNGGIQPGESVTCDVVFDVPSSASLDSAGSSLMLGNFGESDYTQPTMPVGIIRTYH